MSVSAGARAAIGDVLQVDAGHRLEQLAGDVLHRAAAGRGHVDLARIGLGVGDELRNGVDRERGMHLHHVRHADDAGDRRHVADEVEIELLVERRVDGVRGRDEQQRVAVGRRAHHRLGRDVAAGARPALDHERLPEPLGQPLADEPGEDVGRAAGRKADDDAHRPGRPGLRPARSAPRPRMPPHSLPETEIHDGSQSWAFPPSGGLGWPVPCTSFLQQAPLSSRATWR